MILLLLGVSVRWTKPTNPSVDESPENRLITTPCGWRNLATILVTTRKEYNRYKKAKDNMKHLLAFLVDWSDEAATSHQQQLTRIQSRSSREASAARSSAKL